MNTTEQRLHRLSERLNIAFRCLLPHKDVWDICCDHGYLATAAYKSNLFKNIYFVDQVSEIMKNLETRFNQYAFNFDIKSKAFFLQTDASKITTEINGTVCILGVGGLTIIHILKSLLTDERLKAERLILSPHRDEEKVVQFIKEFAQTYKLNSIESVLENKKIRKLYIFDL